MNEATFGTAINCMDGRVQEPVMNWLRENFQVQYVDKINEAGPNKVLLDGDAQTLASIKNRIGISHNGHGSKIIAIAGHHDCAGNPIDKKEKVEQIKQSVQLVRGWGFDMEVVGLYVNDDWEVEQVTEVMQSSLTQ
ncbi:carbonic anhydrase [Alkalibacillus haloalkaliphilus]|uniref:carbonic anhydrase n=1 Tax=Alkalibacillus haloalkaliphilus TaxID=94136 RepID=UPI0029362564|nr:carbonic anhydrase [Alkalibacillus haloalkaliphilus]MDV2582760.1 carbonic anhydrase [Alkalibacillus haloalkaliphilus]